MRRRRRRRRRQAAMFPESVVANKDERIEHQKWRWRQGKEPPQPQPTNTKNTANCAGSALTNWNGTQIRLAASVANILLSCPFPYSFSFRASSLEQFQKAVTIMQNRNNTAQTRKRRLLLLPFLVFFLHCSVLLFLPATIEIGRGK